MTEPEPGSITFPDFVKEKWVQSQLQICDADAKKIGQTLAAADHSWDFVKDKATFAEQFLEKFCEDPGVTHDCRKALGGKDAAPIFKLPSDDEVKGPAAGSSARKCLGHFAACGRAAAERGDSKQAMEWAMLELLEYGGIAEEAFQLAYDVQHLSKYKGYVDAAFSVHMRGYMLALLDEGLNDAESEAEARSLLRKEYTFGKLATLAEDLSETDNPIDDLTKVAEALADAARNAAAYEQISTAPLGTESVVALLKESMAIIEAHLEGSEDKDLFAQAEKAKTLAAECPVQLIDREIVCQVRKLAAETREKTLEASSAADTAASIPVKTLADAKKMASAFEGANKLAKEACAMAIKCAETIKSAKGLESNEQKTKELFEKIAAAFRGAQAGASEEAKKSAAAAKKAQDAAKEAARQLEMAAAEAAKKAKEEAAAAKKEKKAAEAEPTAEAGDTAGARAELLKQLKKFGSKRWDTNMATQTLARLCDRRKEVIGQLWEAVEKEADDDLRRCEKFTEQFRNTMDARRRLDAVVRLIGRGQQMDPRTAKWFTDQIIEISKAAAAYVEAAKGK
ncbi:MAG: hypothetical protein OXC81_04080 [Betaproteobacteria bacterium]|nr:hypothetical protein [Betaproteobacteria bacterium]